jgi:hypothetical protein
MKLVRPADLLVLAFGAALVGASYGLFWGPRSAGDTAVVFVGQTIHRELPLQEERTVTVDGVLGESVIRVSDGRIRFTDSPCPARYCVHTGWIERTGEVAACLPNGVVIEIRGGAREFDAINL